MTGTRQPRSLPRPTGLCQWSRLALQSLSSQACQQLGRFWVFGEWCSGLLAPAHGALVRRLHKRRRNSAMKLAHGRSCVFWCLRQGHTLLPSTSPGLVRITRPNSRRSPHDVLSVFVAWKVTTCLGAVQLKLASGHVHHRPFHERPTHSPTKTTRIYQCYSLQATTANQIGSMQGENMSNGSTALVQMGLHKSPKRVGAAWFD